MPISVQPVDGLINRLLQQNSKPSVSHARPAHQPSGGSDAVNISAQAKSQHQAAAAAPQQAPGNKSLESQLLNLYKSNDTLGT